MKVVSPGQVGAVTEFDLSSHPMAVHPAAQRFVVTMDGNELEAAKGIFEKSGKELREFYGRWFVRPGRDKVANEIISAKKSAIKKWMLQMVFVSTDVEFIDYVLTKIKPSDKLLLSVVNCEDLIDHPDKFTLLLKKITKGMQEHAVEIKVASILFYGKLKSFDPLLHELRSDNFSNSTLADAAIVQAFSYGCVYYMNPERAWFTMHYYDHYAVPADLYATGLSNAYADVWPNSALFGFLLTRARREDLEMVIGRSSFGTKPAEYQEAVIKALDNASPLTRMNERRSRANMIRGILEIGIPIPLVIIKIIWDYDI